MSIFLHNLRGLWIITYSEGVKIGSVQDVVVNAEEKKVAGFLVHAGNPITGKTYWLAADKVKKVGTDVIFVPNEASLTEESYSGRTLESLHGMSVSSKDGSFMGEAKDYGYSKTSWEIDSICLAGNKKVLLNTEETVFGPDMILIQEHPEFTACKSVAPDEEHLVNDITDALRRHASSAFKQGEDLVHQAKQTVKEMLKGETAETQAKEEQEGKSE